MGIEGVIVDLVQEITEAVSDKIKPTTIEDGGNKNLLEGDGKMQMQVAKDPSGKEINALEQHIKNLLNPSILTILGGTLFPMCGLMGIGEPIGRYGDM
ncbi:hypothetical protein Pyn_12674 [Prunus yedoensis var. nudiflora]|uniref:Uncharacterized protein n=1 Tax=Prunus yedoensis var. nudiflora TaxID=2094558 RepID=A0A314Z4Z2_PRUYE|nr:hypothetical protein Pyn_12674 [Prunus yedoensis var. nudiflora]